MTPGLRYILLTSMSIPFGIYVRDEWWSFEKILWPCAPLPEDTGPLASWLWRSEADVELEETTERFAFNLGTFARLYGPSADYPVELFFSPLR